MTDPIEHPWPVSPLGDLVVAKYGKALPQASRRGGSVPVYGSNGVVGYHDAALTIGPAIVIGRKGSSGAINFSDVPCFPIDTTYFIDEPGPFTLEFLTLLLRSLNLQELDRSTAIPGLSREQLYALEVAVPPMQVQESLVSLLTSTRSRGASATRHLSTARRAVERFRRSVLSAACSGLLTSEWREARGLPDWTYEAAGTVCDKVQSGSTPKIWHLADGGVPFLKVYNIVNQQLDFEYRPQFISRELHEGSMARTAAMPGDVLMNIVGPPLGKVAVVTDQYPRWSINQALTLFRPSGRVSTEWLYIFLCSGISVAEIMSSTRGTVGQINISLTQCREFEIPIPSIDEQNEIARRVSALLSLSDRTSSQIEKAKGRVDHISQVVLSKAFRGDLILSKQEV